MVLPGLILRALIPLGFMPKFGPGMSVQLTMCDGYAPLPWMSTDMSMDMPTDMPMEMAAHHAGGRHGSGGSDSPAHPGHSACPYAASSTLASLVASIDVPTPARLTTPGPMSAPQVAHFKMAPRAQSPRGPPLEA